MTLNVNWVLILLAGGTAKDFMIPSMETISSSSSLSVPQEASNYDKISMQQSLLFSDTLEVLLFCIHLFWCKHKLPSFHHRNLVKTEPGGNLNVL